MRRRTRKGVLSAAENQPSKVTILATAQDYLEAIRWFHLAADQGYASSQGWLGHIYSTTPGMVDYVLAHMFFNLAASQQTDKDRKKSVKRRDKLEEKMSREQVAEAERLAREFKPNPSEVTKSLQ